MAINKKKLLFNIFFIFMLFQQVLLQYTSGKINKIISYTDEATECVMICMILYMAIKGTIRLYKVEIVMVFAFITFLFMGFISNAVYPMQNVFYNISDGLVCGRFIVAYYWTRFYFKDNAEEYIDGLNKICRIIAVVMFVLTIHDIVFTPFFPKSDYRYFMYSIKLFFPHSSYMAVACFTCIVILGTQLRKHNKNIIYIVLLEICTFFTLRSKAMASIFAIDVLYIFIFIMHIISPYLIGVISSIGAVAIGWKNFAFFYLLDKEIIDTAVRAKLHKDSVILANDYFPFGTGFATFGSNIAAKHYSDLYVSLGYLNIQGGGVDGGFLSDTFWPIVIAQTGWFGTIAFLIVVIGLIYLAVRIRKYNRYYYWMLLSIVAYELISSTSEPAFFNPSVFIIFILYAMIINAGTKERLVIEENKVD